MPRLIFFHNKAINLLNQLGGCLNQKELWRDAAATGYPILFRASGVRLQFAFDGGDDFFAPQDCQPRGESQKP